MPIRIAEAEWHGNLREGRGALRLGDHKHDFPYTFASRFESGKETNPEELIGAAHAGCFTMALVAALGSLGERPEEIRTMAQVSLERDGEGFRIASIVLETKARVPGIDPAKFRTIAEDAKNNCPVSRALAGIDIRMTANLIG
jgi:lipoyl-dependent peroxiredoxin